MPLCIRGASVARRTSISRTITLWCSLKPSPRKRSRNFMRPSPSRAIARRWRILVDRSNSASLPEVSVGSTLWPVGVGSASTCFQFAPESSFGQVSVKSISIDARYRNGRFRTTSSGVSAASLRPARCSVWHQRPSPTPRRPPRHRSPPHRRQDQRVQRASQFRPSPPHSSGGTGLALS